MDQDELPDWLSDGNDTEPVKDEISDWLSNESETEHATDNLPDWLLDEPEAEPVLDDVSEQPEEAESDMPYEETEMDADNALAWLEGLAAKQGAEEFNSIYELINDEPVLENSGHVLEVPNLSDIQVGPITDDIDISHSTPIKVDNGSEFKYRNLFISYSRYDAEFAQSFNADLMKQGISTWIDQLGIRNFDDWPERIAKAITDCAAMLIVVSPKSMTSKWVRRELALADRLDKPILPLIHRECEFPKWFLFRFGNVQWADFTKGDYEGNMVKVVEAIREVLEND